VVMATCTGDCKTKKGLSKNIDLVIHDICFITQHIRRSMSRLMEIPESGADNRFIPAFFWIYSWLVQQVSSNMLTHKLIKRNIRIEGSYQIVSIFVSMPKGINKFMSVSLCVSNEVHPVPRPFSSCLRRVQHLITELFIAVPLQFLS